jgi:hypothetical protein
MPLAALLAALLLAGDPADSGPVSTAPEAAAPQAPPDAQPAASAPTPAVLGKEDIPPGAPTDDYGFVAWCYGALGEYLDIYETIKPELKAIDKRFGSSVNEPEPYMSDVAEEKQAMKRFSDALRAAEKASPTYITQQGVDDINKGRGIWAAAKLQPKRKLADAWLFWGLPNHCETTAQALKTRSALLGQALATNVKPDTPEPAPPAAPSAPAN